MKNIFIAILLCSATIIGYAQIPDGFSYQAIVRDESGEIAESQNVTFRFSVQRQDFQGDYTVYAEIQNTVTSEYGLVNLVIGEGQAIIGEWTQILWEQVNPAFAWWLKVEIDLGSGFIDLGNEFFKSVPYAELARQNWSMNGNQNTSAFQRRIGTVDEESLSIITNDQTRMHITDYGHIGIGTTDPDVPVHITDFIGTGLYVESTAGFATIDIDGYNGDAALRLFEQGIGRWLIRNELSTNNFEIYELGSSGDVRLLIQDETGNVGIGVSTPLSRLHLSLGSDASLSSHGYLMMGSLESTNLILDNNEIMARSNGAASDLFLNAQGGGVVIHSGTPTTHALFCNGTASKPGGGSWAASSDKRLKHNVHPFEEGLESVLRVNPVTYCYLENTGIDPSEVYVGVIAQDLQKISPFMVEENELTLLDGTNGNYLSVDPSAFTYMLINAVKELNDRNLMLESQLESQSQEMALLSARLSEIEKMLSANSSTTGTQK